MKKINRNKVNNITNKIADPTMIQILYGPPPKQINFKITLRKIISVLFIPIVLIIGKIVWIFLRK